ncbi:hypothetical protein FRC06_011147 [Ceratobasidium sp. 370]|nr:hypothetical protein FRC06_011147 [Ceratobasidium sp. 370]
MSGLYSPPDSPVPEGNAYTSMNNDDSAKYRRGILETLSSLRSLGLTQALDLPQIAVIGSQSAGKSSLIEALCRIKLPRSTGTCTRCPIEFRSQHAEHGWRAQVYIKLEMEDQGRSRWAEEIAFGDTLEDADLVEERIKQAQLAVLNPRIDRAVFLRGDPGPPGGLSFTRNRVVVRISGQDLADLSFVDLPGIISNTADQRNAGDIELVQKLISSYMRKKSTINLIVITCESDIETQAAGRLAAIYDPKGERTIGVITKPDRIEKGQERQWVPLITGQSQAYPLTNGWYCVKQPTTIEREDGCSWEGARVLETEFFDKAAEWSTIPTEYRTNLGTRNLAFKLGQILSNDVQKRLPAIRGEVERLAQINQLELSKLPSPPPHGARDLVQQLVTQFVRDAEKHLIKGNPSAGNEGVVQTIRKAHACLREELQEFAPQE